MIITVTKESGHTYFSCHGRWNYHTCHFHRTNERIVPTPSLSLSQNILLTTRSLPELRVGPCSMTVEYRIRLPIRHDDCPAQRSLAYALLATLIGRSTKPHSAKKQQTTHVHVYLPPPPHSLTCAHCPTSDTGTTSRVAREITRPCES